MIDEIDHPTNNVMKNNRAKLITNYLEDFVKDDLVKERVLSRHLKGKGAKAGKGSNLDPTRLREPTSDSAVLWECEKGLSEEDCQARKIAVEKQMLQMIALQEKLEQEGVVAIDYDDFKYLDIECIAQANAVQIAYHKVQLQNHALATTDSDCNESARENFCTSNCNEIIVLFGSGCTERETPRDIIANSYAQVADINAQLIAVLKQQAQIAALEEKLSSTSCDICKSSS